MDVPEGYGKAGADHKVMVEENETKIGGPFLVFHVEELYFNKDIEMS